VKRRVVRFVLCAAAIAIVSATCSSAFAYDETVSGIPANGVENCGSCHDPWGSHIIGGTGTRIGVHGGYLATTSKCEECHTVHDAPEGTAHLLPGPTVTATCFTCHDGTTVSGEGVYGAIAARGLIVGGEHSVDATRSIPGGDSSTGGSVTGTFSGVDQTLTCSDCHSPHGSDCVTPFLGERQRAGRFTHYSGINRLTVQVQNRLLKQRPGTTTTSVADYGSDWCAACHAGRPSGLAMVNGHPVDSLIATDSPTYTPYNYRQLAIIGTGSYPTNTIVLGPAGINTRSTTEYNRAYLMPYPRVGAQQGHYPICQQCHEDTRDVGSLTADGTQANPSAVVVTTADGTTTNDNPRFQNFPHETTGYRLLVEAGTTDYTDGLCMNCHPTVALP
jgi:hypothetical protein